MGHEVGGDLVAVASGIIALGAVGAPLACRWLATARAFERLAAAPVLGCALYAVLATILYRAGVPPARTLGAAAGLGLVAWLWSRRSSWPLRLTRDALVLCAATAGVGALALAPQWTGGPQFTIFQGNQLDQRNYLAAALSYERYSYAQLTAHGTLFDSSFKQFGARNLGYRPAVALELAGIARFWPGRTTEATYTYMALLVVLWFLAGVFVVARLWSVGLGRAALVSAGLALGFFSQYVLDINAWSELAAIPVAFVALVAAFEASQGSVASVVAWGSALAGLAFLYPESLPTYGLASVLAPLAGARAGVDQTRRHLRASAWAAGAMLVLCALYWHGTLGFLWGETTETAVLDAPPYYRFFQRYLWGIDAQGAATTPYAFISLPIDFVAGAFGLYMLGLPAADLGAGARLAWKLGEGALLLALAGSAVACARRNLGHRDGRAAFTVATLMVLVIPAVAVLVHYWLAGKLYSMVAPLVYLMLALPLFETPAGGRRHLRRALAWLYVCGQIAFGLVRPIYAGRPDGIHYAWPPYPSIRGEFLKTDYAWDFRTHLLALAGCRHVRLDVHEPLVAAFAQMALEDHGFAWSARGPIRAFDTNASLSPGTRGHADLPDCVLSDAPQPASARRVATLRRR